MIVDSKTCVAVSIECVLFCIVVYSAQSCVVVKRIMPQNLASQIAQDDGKFDGCASASSLFFPNKRAPLWNRRRDGDDTP